MLEILVGFSRRLFRNLSKGKSVVFVLTAFGFVVLPNPAWSFNAWQPSNFATNSGACANNSDTINGLSEATPYVEQMGQFALYSGVGYGYVAASTVGTSLTVTLPAGATVVAAFLIQLGGFTPTCCGLGTCTNTTIGGTVYSNCSGDGTGTPATAATTFGGTAFAGTVTGTGNFVTLYDTPYWGLDSNDNWEEGAYSALFNVTSKVTGSGTYTVAELGNGGSAEVTPMSTLYVVYQIPTANYDGVVALADGLYYWHAQDDDAPAIGAVHDGSRPLPTTLNWSCSGYSVCDTTTTQFTRSGETNCTCGASLYTDDLIAYGTSPTAPALPASQFTSGSVLTGLPDQRTYTSPSGGFAVGATGITWDLGGQTSSKTSYAVDSLAASFQCPLQTPTDTPTNTKTPTLSVTVTPTVTKTDTLTDTPTVTLTVTV